MSKKIFFVQHESFEAPGAILTWAKERNYSIDFSKVYEYDPLPEEVGNIDLLVVLGGPQSPYTSKAECPHFDALAEMALIQKCVHAGKAVLGVCLGAQLIAAALGATVEHSPEKEIGIFPIQVTNDGLKDDKVAHFGSELTVGHWHSDMPGLTAESRVLAFSEGCPRQIIVYADLVYGFQCHMELTKEVVELLIESESNLYEKSRQFKFIQSPEEMLSYDYSEMNDKLCHFLDKLVRA